MPPQNNPQDNMPDFIPHTPSAASATPDFIPHTPTGGNAQGTMGPPASGESLYSRALSKVGVDPDNPLARGVGAFASTVAHAPSALYHAVKDPLTPEEEADFKGHTRIPGEVTLERLTGAREIVSGAKQWADPKTRPTLAQAKYIAPEALGQSAGNYAAAELMGKVGEGTAGQIAQTVKTVPAIADAIRDAGRSVERKLALDRGIAQVYKDNVQIPLDTYRAVVNREIDLHAQAVLQADSRFNQMRNIHGAIDTTEAASGGLKVLDELGKTNPKIEQIRQRLVGQIPLMDAKNLLTDIGSEASKMKYAGRAREAAPLWEMYDKLSDATSDHVDSLGQPFKKSWDHYRNEHRTLMEHNGLIDDLNTAGTPQQGLFNFTDAMGDVRGKGRQNQIAALKKDMAKYGVDTDPLDTAAEQGSRLRDLTHREGNVFVGKLRAMVTHPATIAPIAIGAGMAAGALGLGAMGHILVPLLVAGKLTGMMDSVGIAKFLREVKATTRPESGIPFRGEMEGPQKVPAVPTEETGGTTPTQQKGATKGEVEDMQAAQEAEDERQIMAKKVGRAKRAKGKP